MIYDTPQLYPDVKAVQCQGENIVYYKPRKQENLYAVYRTADNSFWSSPAKECQQEVKSSGAEGKRIEARELIIALPEIYTHYESQQVLEDFTEEFRRRYDVEYVSALHHNKRKSNYHIHLIFSERRLLAEPDLKIATRAYSMMKQVSGYARKKKSPMKAAKSVRAAPLSRKAAFMNSTFSP